LSVSAHQPVPGDERRLSARRAKTRCSFPIIGLIVTEPLGDGRLLQTPSCRDQSPDK
jgi:hypothetical protein